MQILLTSQQSAQMCNRMREIVRLIAEIVQRDKYPKVVSPWGDANPCACEVGADLIEAAGRNALLRALDKVCRHWWVVRSLLGQIGDANRSLRLGSCWR